MGSRRDATARDSEGRKQCRLCQRWQAESEYYTFPRSIDGLRHECRSCQADQQSLRNYGLTRGQIAERVAEQGGCAACGSPEPGRGKGWHVDHDHRCCPSHRTCGECVRGILCASCNVALGLVNDSVERLQQLAEYVGRY